MEKAIDIETAIGYTRVSTAEQASEGVSLAMQKEKIRLYCELNDLQLVDIREDAGLSAKDFKGRPGIQKILSMIQEKKIKHLVIFKLDRLSRCLRDACKIADMMQKHGVSLHSVCEKLDTGSATGKFFYHILAAMAEWERGMISERTISGLNQKRACGEKIGRFFPRGMKAGEQTITKKGKVVFKLAADPKELEAIRMATELRQDNHPYRAISAILAEAGYLSRTNKPYTASSIKKMLESHFQIAETA